MKTELMKNDWKLKFALHYPHPTCVASSALLAECFEQKKECEALVSEK